MNAKPSFWELAGQALSDTQTGYDLLAKKFEATEYATPVEWVEACLRRVDKRFPLPEDRPAHGIDLACGTGRGARALRARCLTVEGIDFSPGMLSEASRLSWPLDGLQWTCRDLDGLCLEACSADRIVSFGAWGHILPSFRQPLLETVLKGLKKGGVFCTLTADEPSWKQSRFWKFFFFDSAIRLRNRVWPRQFHMYYRLNGTLSLYRELRAISKMEDCFEISLEPLVPFLELPLTLLTVYRRPTD